jgi:ankyrin repeat protein
MSETLPAHPDLDWYKKAAKQQLLSLRASNPAAKLADAQLAIAREHGFASWRKLKERIDQITTDLPALFDAIKRDDRTLIAQLLKRKPALARAADANGHTALHVAAEDNNPDAIAILLASKANVQASFGQSAHTALSWALTTRAFDSAAALVRGGVKPDFFCAAGLGDLDRVKTFFDHKGNLRPNASHTGSSRFAPDGSRLPCPPTESRELISDALYFACRNGHATVTRELLAHDPDLSFRAFMGGTPLHWAYFGGNRKIVELLLAHGADPNLRDSVFHCTARTFGLCVAANWGFAPILIKTLQCDPTGLNTLDGRGTPLHEAARSGNAQIVQILLKIGADPKVRDREHKTALDRAVAGKHDATAAILLQASPPA